MEKPPITLDIFTARHNKAWPEALRQHIRFLRFSAAVPCAECGAQRKTHWTMLVAFAAHTFQRQAFDLQRSGRVHGALQPVCRTHVLAPVLEPDPTPPEADDATPPA